MATPITFPSTTSNLALPLLFSGQAQKEFTLNQALSIIDALLQSSATGSFDTPPSQAEEGEFFRVLSGAMDDWAGHEDEIAVRIGGGWHFVAPRTGMTIFDQAAAQTLHYNSGWQTAVDPTAPSGGSTVDAEARVAIAELIETLRNVGIFAT